MGTILPPIPILGGNSLELPSSLDTSVFKPHTVIDPQSQSTFDASGMGGALTDLLNQGQQSQAQNTQASDAQQNSAASSGDLVDKFNNWTKSKGWTTGHEAFTWGRIAAFVVGLICIAMGLMMFKTTQQIITTTGKVVAKGAELAA